MMHCMLIDWLGLELCSKDRMFITGTPSRLIFIVIFYDGTAGEKRTVAIRGCIGSVRNTICFYFVTLYLYSICMI